MVNVATNGKEINKIGSSYYRAVGYAYCGVNYYLISNRRETHITHELKTSGRVGKSVPSWTC